MDIPHLGQYLLLDGATTTNLYAEGMPYDTCVEEYILKNPMKIKKLQQDFVLAGSDILFAPTFGANRVKLNEFGLGDKVHEFNTRLVALTKDVAGDKLVAGNLSLTGVTGLQEESPTDLQEGFCELGEEDAIKEMIGIYSEQAQALFEAGVDIFAIESMNSIIEARAAVLACKKYDKPIFVTFTVSERGKAMSGASMPSALVTMQALGVSAFGFNCSYGLELLEDCLSQISSLAKIPLIVKPNAGMQNPLLANVYDLSPTIMAAQMKKFLDAGAAIIGGCCGTTPEHISEMRKLLDTYTQSINFAVPLQNNDIILSNDMEVFALDNDRIEFTQPINCEYDMADSLLAAEEDSLDVLMIHINSADDAHEFANNINLASLPVCIYSTSEEALEIALLSYNGRAMVDSQSPIEADVLGELAKHYGAVIY